MCVCVHFGAYFMSWTNKYIESTEINSVPIPPLFSVSNFDMQFLFPIVTPYAMTALSNILYTLYVPKSFDFFFFNSMLCCVDDRRRNERNAPPYSLTSNAFTAYWCKFINYIETNFALCVFKIDSTTYYCAIELTFLCGKWFCNPIPFNRFTSMAIQNEKNNSYNNTKNNDGGGGRKKKSWFLAWANLVFNFK